MQFASWASIPTRTCIDSFTKSYEIKDSKEKLWEQLVPDQPLLSSSDLFCSSLLPLGQWPCRGTTTATFVLFLFFYFCFVFLSQKLNQPFSKLDQPSQKPMWPKRLGRPFRTSKQLHRASESRTDRWTDWHVEITLCPIPRFGIAALHWITENYK